MDRQTHAMTFYGKAAGLTDENVTRVVPDGGRVWIGMENGGLDMLDVASGRIQHVYPIGRSGNTMVSDILVRPDGVWLAGMTDGLLRLDPATLAVTRVPVLDNVAVMRLLDQGDTIWVGSAYKGIYSFDPSSQQTQWYGTGKIVDYIANCMTIHNGILYLGTYWGVERFDIAAHTFLPQVGRLPLGAASLGAASGPAALSIESPAEGQEVDPGAALLVAGHAVAPPGSQVEVRLGDGPWQPAEGTDGWSATLALPSQVGPLAVTARLDRDGAELAQVVRTVYVGMDAAGAAAVAATAAGLRHVPVLQAGADEPLWFRVDGAQGLPNVTATLEVRRPGGVGFDPLPMVTDANGTLVAELAPMGTAGEAEYRILVQWDGGNARFPAPFSAYGETYHLLVTGKAGAEAAVITGKTSFLMPASGPVHIDVMVQNTGVRTALFNVSAAGVPAQWVRSMPATLQIPPSSSQALPLDLVVPAGQKGGRYDLGLTLAPVALGMSTTQAQVHLLVPNAGSGGHLLPKLSPSPAWLALLAVAGLAAARRSRR